MANSIRCEQLLADASGQKENPTRCEHSLPDDGNSFCAPLVRAFESKSGRNASRLVRPCLDTFPPNLLATLSGRELELLQLITSGITNRAVAERIAISEGAVKRYLHHLYSSWGVNRQTLAVLPARAWNSVSETLQIA